MKNTVRREDFWEFGKDQGLMHEVIVTGRKVGAYKNFWSSLAHDKELFKKVVSMVMLDGFKASYSQRCARKIMCNNFLGIEETTQYFGVKFREEELAQLEEIPFTEKTLKERKYTHILVAGYPLSILDIDSRTPIDIFSATDYSDERFVREEKVVLKWYLINKDIEPHSRGKNYQDQLAVKWHSDEVPRTCEVVYGVLLYYLARGSYALRGMHGGMHGGDVYARCQDVISRGHRIAVGYRDDVDTCRPCLRLVDHSDDYRDVSIGLALSKTHDSEFERSLSNKW